MTASGGLLAGLVPEYGSTRDARDTSYYYSLVTFKVEGCLFRVPRATIEAESVIFRDMFQLPPQTHVGDIEQGVQGEEPIELQQVSKEAFRDLLSIIYPSSLISRPSGSGHDPLSNWTKARILAVIELAHMWEIKSVKKMLAENLAEDLWKGLPLLGNCVDEILLLHKYELKSLYLPAYAQLAKREEPISEEEGEKLGLSFSLKMSAVREKHSSKIAKEYRGKIEALRGGLLTIQRNTPVPVSVIDRNYTENQKFIRDTVGKLIKGSSIDSSSSGQTWDDVVLQDVKEAFNLPRSANRPHPRPDRVFRFQRRQVNINININIVLISLGLVILFSILIFLIYEYYDVLMFSLKSVISFVLNIGIAVFSLFVYLLVILGLLWLFGSCCCM